MEPQQKQIEFYIAPLSKRFGWRRFSIRQGFIDFPAKSNGQAFFALVNGSNAGGSDTVLLHVFDCSAFFSRNSPRCRSPPFVGFVFQILSNGGTYDEQGQSARSRPTSKTT